MFSCLSAEGTAGPRPPALIPLNWSKKNTSSNKKKPFHSQIGYSLLQIHQDLVDFQLFPSCAYREIEIQELSPAARERKNRRKNGCGQGHPDVGLGFSGASCSGALLSQQSHSRNLGTG